jgi:hypothetical protein
MSVCSLSRAKKINSGRYLKVQKASRVRLSIAIILSIILFRTYCLCAGTVPSFSNFQTDGRFAQMSKAADPNSPKGSKEWQTTDIPSSGNLQPEHASKNGKSPCPRLQSMLLHMSQTDNPLQLAEQAGLTVRGNKIQVILMLTDPNETEFLKAFDVEIGQKEGCRIQAFVPVDRLCELANADQVMAVRSPAKALPQ